VEWESSFSFCGTEGTLELRNGAVSAIAFKDVKLQKRIERELAKIKDADHKMGKSYYGPSHPALVLDFVKAARGQGEYFIPARAAAHAVDLVLSVYKSHDEGRRVKLKLR
jgi:predicted dehydrogenase